MDPVTVVSIGAGFAASCVAQKCADAVIDTAWGKIRNHLKSVLGRDPKPADLAIPPDSVFGSAGGVQFAAAIESVFSASPALRRAKAAENCLNGARILWVDDHPEGNEWERSTLRGFGVDIMSVEATSAAIECLKNNEFDLVVSDITRDDSAETGLDAIPRLRAINSDIRLVFYVAELDSTLGTPPRVFGITNEPEELLHLVVDVMERIRS